MCNPLRFRSLTIGSYLRRLQEAAAAAAQQQQDIHAQGSSSTDLAHSPTSHGAASPTLSSGTQGSLQPFLEPSLSPVSPLHAGPLSPGRYPITADGTFASFGSVPSLGAAYSAARDDPHPFSNSNSGDQFSTYPLHGWALRQQQTLTVSSPVAIPPLAYYYRPHRLEDVAPRDTILHILALFFDFVYPLTPCIHRPSFMADVHARREERDPLFFALVMSTVASTLVQVPRSYLPMERHQVRKLAQTCYEASRHISVVSYDPPTVMHVVIRYL